MKPSKEFVESQLEMEKVLREEHLGYLGLCMDGQPYVIPVNYAYVPGRILFHGALEGKKMDFMRANPQVCFTVGRQSGEVVRHAQGEVCHIDNDSVVCFGPARIIEDVQERHTILNDFNRCLRPDGKEITLEEVKTCSAVEIRVTEMTGRQERDGKSIFRRHTFEQ